ncbi:hypothetical protein F5972_03555 [Microbispora cellulosiformans]|uniref:AAA+ ATPase domain-containing protein n=1 Tax=Microbispora cellulosiformans TaxID=2614688 RepID=A0A5J5KCB2_9ACTN|nr:hypothetical protein [Microbispora cellulosiformans]KAA9381903.1 hypothetical protein F5972_03555 [Microbispora cellulosiformans]
MGNKPLSYTDAVKLLGGSSRVITALSRLAGGTLTVASAGGSDVALSLFDLKGEVDQLSQSLFATLRDRVRGLSRFRRTELIEAAHAVVVAAAFFSALDDLDDEILTALNTASLELTRDEQVALAGGGGLAAGRKGLANLALRLTTANGKPGLVIEPTGEESRLVAFYEELTDRLLHFASGTAVWDARDETQRARWTDVLSRNLPSTALGWYEEHLRKLASEFPEVAFWAHRLGMRSILDELHKAHRDSREQTATLHALTSIIGRIGQGRDPSRVREDLVRRYRRQLDAPVARAETVPEAVTLPTLRQIYINPSYRSLPTRGRSAAPDRWISEGSWQEEERRDDLWAFLMDHLMSTPAADTPLVVLGQPGAGKSLFTQVLAAELDPADFLVVRVELRAVPSDAEIQRQIEVAMNSLTGTTLSWPEFTAESGTAQPVILLDGFDELLQASGVSHYDFLERVQAFQRREAELDRPVAVIVTSRTAVADQVRYPEGTVVVRLENFDDDQVGRWLATWNDANPATPLTPGAALAQGELCRQPLLLFMLALFHSGGGALTPGIGQAQLYERLFTRFAERDVGKLDDSLPDHERRRAVARELDRLSAVAFSMFNRGRQTVTDKELVADFAVLPIGGGSSYASGSIGTPSGELRRAAALDVAQRLAGRFFFRLFVQQAQAVYGQESTRKTYEFLHASFGEFLVARWVVGEVRRLARRAREAADDPCPPPPDDALLNALLSKAVISTREQRILGFVHDLLGGLDGEEPAELRAVLCVLFRRCLRTRGRGGYDEYRPVELSAPAEYAVYSANLVLLLLLVSAAQAAQTGDGAAALPLSELYASAPPRSAEDRRAAWRSTTRLWHSQLTGNEWDSIVRVIRVDLPGADAQEVLIGLWDDEDDAADDRDRSLPLATELFLSAQDIRIPRGNAIVQATREATMLDSRRYRDACSTLLPYAALLPFSDDDVLLGRRSAAMMKLLLTPPGKIRAQTYGYLFAVLTHHDVAPDVSVSVEHARLVLALLRTHADRIPTQMLRDLCGRMRVYRWANMTAFLDVHAKLRTSYSGELESAGTPFASGLFTTLGLFDLLDLRASGYILVPPVSDESAADLIDRLLDVLKLDGRFSLWRRDVPDVDALLGLAIWTNCVERGLLGGNFRPIALSRRQFDVLQTAAPGFVTRTRSLAEEQGLPDPFDVDWT